MIAARSSWIFTRLTGASKNTVTRLLVGAGRPWRDFLRGMKDLAETLEAFEAAQKRAA
jgi:hypothetical protein